LKQFIILCCLVVSKLRANIILGVDLGSDYFKMNILKPGKSFTMVENLQSKTKTPAGVTFKNNERLFGSESLINKAKNSKQTLNFIDRFLGEKYGSTKAEQYIKDNFVNYDMFEDENRKSYQFKLKYNGEDLILSPEEHFGMIFRHIKSLTEQFIGSKVYEVVVSVPNSWGYKKRHSLSQSVRLSGLELKGIVTQNTAAAVQWMSDKSFNETAHYIFYNMGSSYTQASLVSLYSRYETDKKNSTTEYREVTVLAEAWDDSLGGRDFDMRLVKMLMDMHDSSPQKKGKDPVQGNPKIAEKILPQAIKTKEVLSSNKQAAINILGIESGMNLMGSVQKVDFEEKSKDLIDRVYEPIEKLFKISGLTKENITQVELIGGGVRIPKIQEVLKEKMGADLIGVHMNGDDCFAFGTAYLFANSTKHFKVKKRVYSNSGPPFEIKIDIDPYTEKTNHKEFCPEDLESIEYDCTRKISKNTTLFKLRHGSDVTRTVTFKHDSDIQIKAYERKEGAEFQENIQDQQDQLLMTFYVTGFDEVKESLKKDNFTALPKSHLRFRSNEAGLVSLSADVTYEVDVYFAKVKGENDTVEYKYVSEFVEPLSEEDLEKELEIIKSEGKNETDSEYTKIKSIGKSKKSERKIDLTVERVFTFPRPLNKTEFEASKKKLDEIDNNEILRIKNMEARNSLETDIYAKREWIEGQEATTYANSTELVKLDETIKSIAEWYDEDGWNANTTCLIEKHDEIKDLVKPIERRIKKHDKRVKSTENMKKELEKIKKDSEKLLQTKDWLEKHYHENFHIEYTKIETWFNEKMVTQSELTLQEDVHVTGEQIDSKIKALKREFSKFKDIPKPKPVGEKDTEEEKDENKGKDKKFNKEEMEELIKKMKGNNGGYDNLNTEDRIKMEEMMAGFGDIKAEMDRDSENSKEGEVSSENSNTTEDEKTEQPTEEAEEKEDELKGKTETDL